MAGRLVFFGHATFRIDTDQGLKIWIDPWLENPKAPKDIGPLEADLVLITHAHGDHMGSCLSLAKRPSTEVVVIHELQQYLLTKGLPNVTGMNIGGSYKTKGVKITMVPAIHSSSIQEGQELIYGGDPAGFVIELEDGFCIYHAGDTALFSDMSLIKELYQPKVALLPIGDHYVMGPKEAAYACKLLEPEEVIPMHYGTFPALTGTVKEFKEYINKFAPKVRVVPLEPGEEYAF